MIPAGITFCPHCGTTFSKNAFYYKGSEHRWGVVLLRTLRGGYELMPYANDGNLSDVLPVEYAGADEKMDSIWVKVTTRDKDGKEEIKDECWHRCCPHCKHFKRLPGLLGTVPTYVFLMAGEVSAGKSSLCTTVSTTDELQPFIANFGSPYYLKAHRFRDSQREIVKDTGISMAESSWFDLWDSPAEKELKAIILLRDLGGELYTEERRGELIRFFSRRRNYKPDGVFFLTPYNSGKSCTDAYNNVMNYFRQDMPVAFVATFLDKLFTDPAYQKTRAEDGQIVKLGLSALKSLVGKMDEESTRKRFALENMLFLRMMGPHKTSTGKTELRQSKAANLLSMRQGTRTAGFLVQAWSKENDEKGTKNGADDAEKMNQNAENAGAQCFNAIDPLIWMLIQSGLLHWTTPGGRNDG